MLADGLSGATNCLKGSMSDPSILASASSGNAKIFAVFVHELDNNESVDALPGLKEP